MNTVIANNTQRRQYTNIPYGKIEKYLNDGKNMTFIARKINRYNEGKIDPLQEVRGIISRMRTKGYTNDLTGMKMILTPKGAKALRGRGRPAGSKNHAAMVSSVTSTASNTAKRGRGRPKGSKNKPKFDAVTENNNVVTADSPLSIKTGVGPGRPSSKSVSILVDEKTGIVTLKVPNNSATVLLEDLKNILDAHSVPVDNEETVTVPIESDSIEGDAKDVVLTTEGEKNENDSIPEAFEHDNEQELATV